MKRLLSILPVLLFSLAGKSQITLEHSYQSNSKYFNVSWGNYGSAGFKYSVMNTNANSMTLYNTDHSIWKTLSFPVPAGFTLNTVHSISETAFDTDSGLEIAYSYYSYNGTVNPPTFVVVMKIIEEDGTVIKTINQCPSVYVIDSGSGVKMLATIDSTNKSSVMKVEVYSLPGTATSLSKNQNQQGDLLSTPFPNPSQNKTTIYYSLPEGHDAAELVIYDLNGKELKRYKVDSTFNNLELNNADLPTGTYFYNLALYDGTTAARKMVIVK